MRSLRIAGYALAGISTLCTSLTVLAQATTATRTGAAQSSTPSVPPLVVPNGALTEGFEAVTFPPTNWIVRNQSTVVGSNTTCWNRFTTTPWAPNTGVGHSGANFNCTTGTNTISGWLIGPNINLQNGDTISFFTRKATPDTFPDRLQLRLCQDTTPDSCGAAGSTGTLSTDVGSFTGLLVDVNPTLVTGVYPTTFTQFSAVLSGLPGAGVNGRFAFRYFVTNGGPSGANSDIISIDDVALVAGAVNADLSITKTDGVTTVAAGTTTTYTITASNAGPSGATGATVADTFPANCNAPTWTCVGAGGGTCTAAGSGNINDTVNLPSGASVTYTASCPVPLAASGTLDNTATVTAPGGVTDPNLANNSATDSDTITGPALTSTPISGSTITFNAITGGTASSIITFANPGGVAATVTCTAPAATQFTVIPLVINVPAGASNFTTVSFTSPTPGTFGGSLTCTAGAQTFTFTLTGIATAPTSVPTLGQWALLLLALSTVMGAFLALSRRRAKA